MKSFKDYLDYYKQTGKLPSGIDQGTMDAAVQNADQLGIPSETTQIPFAPENQTPALSDVKLAGEDASVPSQESATQKAIKLAAAKPATASPTVSPETQDMGIGEKPAPVNPSEDKAMEDALAQAKANQEEARSEMVRRLLFQGVAGLGSGQQVNLSKDLETNLEKTANMPVEQLQVAREQQLKKMQVEEESAKNDPNSAVSKVMRDTLKEMGVTIPANATYATMEKLAPQIMRNKEFQMRMQEMAMRREELASNKADREALKKNEAVAKVRDKFLSSERYKGSMEQKTALDSARVNLELAKKGHSQAYAALGANLAKIAGEKGMLSEADVNRYLKEKGVPGRIQNGVFETTGRPTRQQLANLEDMLTDMSGALNSKMQKMAENEIAGYSYGYGVEPSQIEGVLPELQDFKAQKAAATKGSVDNSTLQEYATKHNISVDKARELLSKAGYNVE